MGRCYLCFGCRDKDSQPGDDSGIKRFTFDELQTATNQFSRAIGRGSFGHVCWGKLQGSGQNVVVKRLFVSGSEDEKNFPSEAERVSLLQHPNIVKLIGYCADDYERLLVYEYMPLGSLETFLHGKLGRVSERITLDWKRRMRIATDVASALNFLHSENVTYRALKSSNVLLGEEFCAKLSDLGFAKPVEDAVIAPAAAAVSKKDGRRQATKSKKDGPQAATAASSSSSSDDALVAPVASRKDGTSCCRKRPSADEQASAAPTNPTSTRIMRSRGYAAPEYAYTGNHTIKSDVYNFGILLLELISGIRPADMVQGDGSSVLAEWARPLVSDDEPQQYQLPTTTDFPKHILKRAAQVALMCVEDEPDSRANMIDVVEAMNRLVDDEQGDQSSKGQGAFEEGQSSKGKGGFEERQSSKGEDVKEEEEEEDVDEITEVDPLVRRS